MVMVESARRLQLSLLPDRLPTVKGLDVAATIHTGNRVLGTPAYLSPEALREPGEDDDVDTRSDVYSLFPVGLPVGCPKGLARSLNSS